MRIVVLVKYVPDTLADRGFTADLRCDRTVEGLLSEMDEYALHAAAGLTGKSDELVAVTVGPKDALGPLRRALAMGPNRGVLVSDEAISGSDTLATARVLAAVIRRLGGADLVVTGSASTDAGTGLVPMQVAVLAGLPAVVGAKVVEVSGDRIRVHRSDETEDQVVSAALPALVAVTDQSEEPTYPNLRATLAARRKPVETWNLADLGLAPDEVGPAAAGTRVRSADPVPARSAGQVIHDDGTAGQRLAEFLSTVTA